MAAYQSRYTTSNVRPTYPGIDWCYPDPITSIFIFVGIHYGVASYHDLGFYIVFVHSVNDNIGTRIHGG